MQRVVLKATVTVGRPQIRIRRIFRKAFSSMTHVYNDQRVVGDHFTHTCWGLRTPPSPSGPRLKGRGPGSKFERPPPPFLTNRLAPSQATRRAKCLAPLMNTSDPQLCYNEPPLQSSSSW